ncbi:MAG: hypothetical protein AB7N91_25055 [Candidatus Tectimicrobiota bacterium]
MLVPGCIVGVVWGVLLALAGLSWSAEPLAGLRVLALAPAAGQAVVRWPDGRLLLVRVGDVMGASGARLLQVLPDRLVLDEVHSEGAALPTPQQVWLYKAPGDGGESRLVRLYRTLPASEQPGGAEPRAVAKPVR